MSTPKTRKRKQPPRSRGRDRWAAEEHDVPSAPDLTLFVQAHEADVVRGPRAHAAADSLEVTYYVDAGKRKARIGEGLIKWQGAAAGRVEVEDDREELVSLGQASTTKRRDEEDAEGLWMDR